MWSLTLEFFDNIWLCLSLASFLVALVRRVQVFTAFLVAGVYLISWCGLDMLYNSEHASLIYYPTITVVCLLVAVLIHLTAFKPTQRNQKVLIQCFFAAAILSLIKFADSSTLVLLPKNAYSSLMILIDASIAGALMYPHLRIRTKRKGKLKNDRNDNIYFIARGSSDRD